MSDQLWQPHSSRISNSNIHRFSKEVTTQQGIASLESYFDLHRWSIQHPGKFWVQLEKFAGICWQAPYEKSYEWDGGDLRSAKWFCGGKLNYAQNMLANLTDTPIISIAEGCDPKSISRDKLRKAVAQCQAGLIQAGVSKGDRVCGVLINGVDAVVAMLATSALGAVWSSSSPDFGTDGIVDRFSQIEPKVLFYSPSYIYNGKRHDLRERISQVLDAIPTITKVVACDHLGGSNSPHTLMEEFGDADAELQFQQCDFRDPLYIMFSSGTTGVPKCMMHSIGGTLLQHKKEHLLHVDLKQDERLFYFTTCGWMMWNWMVSALTCGAGIVCFDGSIASPSLARLWEVIRDFDVNVFGTSPKFLSACAQVSVVPKQIVGDSLKALLSTGAPLAPEQFDWVYDNVKQDLHLASISGGTDIISCFMLGVPSLPVWRGEIQAPGLGMDIAAADSQGESVVGEKGELVCRTPFPSMPVGFWGDPEGEKYRKAYFQPFADSGESGTVWRHGDFVEVTERGGVVVYGRSDATLNPGGVRIGTAELYRQAEQQPGVIDSIAVGLEVAGDTQVVLFVKFDDTQVSFEQLSAELRDRIKSNLTPRHVPSHVVPVEDIPYTRSGKKVELAVTEAIHGRAVANINAIANPDALSEYQIWGESVRS